jgi:hypothetical protein
MTTTWNQYDYVCSYCDSAITFVTTITQDTMLCPVCFNGYATLLSVADVTIPSTTTTKEETMETTSVLNMVTKEYLQNEIDTLKKQLASHQNCDYWKSENGRIGSQLIDLVNASYDGDEDASFILESLCEIIDYNPVKTVQFEGVIHFSGSMDIPRNEVADFDLTQALEDVYVDINNGNVVIDNYELYSVEEPY